MKPSTKKPEHARNHEVHDVRLNQWRKCDDETNENACKNAMFFEKDTIFSWTVLPAYYGVEDTSSVAQYMHVEDETPRQSTDDIGQSKRR